MSYSQCLLMFIADKYCELTYKNMGRKWKIMVALDRSWRACRDLVAFFHFSNFNHSEGTVLFDLRKTVEVAVICSWKVLYRRFIGITLTGREEGPKKCKNPEIGHFSWTFILLFSYLSILSLLFFGDWSRRVYDKARVKSKRNERRKMKDCGALDFHWHGWRHLVNVNFL